MKKSIVYQTIIAVFIISGLNAESEPDRLTTLRSQYSKAVERAITPITKKYIQQLKALKLSLTRAGKLEEAIAVDKELKKLQSDTPAPSRVEDILLATTWRYSSGSHISTFTFKDDGTVIVVGVSNDKWKWKVHQNSKLTIYYSDGNSCVFDFKNLSANMFTGKTRRGNKSRSLVPITQ